MPDRFESPGVFFTEIDKSYIEPSPPRYGFGFIGLTEKGPAFEPVKVETWSDFTALFGEENSDYYLPYAVKGYLKYANPATIIRVLGLATYTQTIAGATGYPYAIVNSSSLTTNIAPILYGEIYTRGVVEILKANTGSQNFTLVLSGSGGTIETKSGLSLDPNASTYFKKVLNTDPSSSYYYYVKGGYNWNYASNIQLHVTRSALSLIPGKYDASGGGDLSKYNNAQTTWIQSQNYGATTSSRITFDLFKVHSLSDGDNSNNDIKVSIANIEQSPNLSASEYGMFDLYVRKYSDNDDSPEILEQFSRLTLDPDANNYIGKVIGDKYREWSLTDGHFTEHGNYPVKAKYIRVELSTDLENVPKTAVPYGFEAYHTPVQFIPSGAASNLIRTEGLPTNSVSSVRDYYGIKFRDKISDAFMVSVSHSISSQSLSNYYTMYDLATENSCAISTASVLGGKGGHLSSSAYKKWRKFTLPMYRGFDSYDPSANLDYNSLGTTLDQGFMQAAKIAGNEEELDVTDIFIPGISDSSIVEELLTNIENRADVFAIVDLVKKTDTVATAQANADGYDSSYAATYFPWIQIFDAKSNKYVYVPPSTIMAQIFAFTDKTKGSWFAPAGITRGKIDKAIDTYVTLTNDDRSDLYNHGVNPIATFKTDGIVVWGQKTLQKKTSKLDRVNVRRLMIEIKKFVRYQSMQMAFEQAGPEFWNEFINRVSPFLEDIKNRKGLYDYKVIMDESLNPVEVEQRRQVRGMIRVNPQVSGEYFDVSFIIDATGTSFRS
jgi:hypothetical protein